MLPFPRSQSLDRPPSASWLDHKHKELVGYCTLLQEHSHQCYVKGEGLPAGEHGLFLAVMELGAAWGCYCHPWA